MPPRFVRRHRRIFGAIVDPAAPSWVLWRGRGVRRRQRGFCGASADRWHPTRARVAALQRVEEAARIRLKSSPGVDYADHFDSRNAMRKPVTVIMPAASCACSYASGIIVSASIARMPLPPAAVVEATASCGTPLNTTYPSHDAIAEA